MPNHCPKWLQQFSSPPAMNETSCSSAFLPTIDIVSVFFIFTLAILVDAYWNLTIVSTCNFLRINDIEHHFICLFSICLSSLVRCLFRSSAYFFNFFFFCNSWVLRILCICWIQILYQICFKNIFSLCNFLFILLTVSFAEQTFNLVKYNSSIFFMDFSFRDVF